MPCLVMLAAKAFGPHRRRGDVVMVKPADWQLGTREIANPENRYAYVYITDVDFDDPVVQNFVEDEVTGQEEVSPGVFRDVREPLRRIRKLDPQDIPGNAARFLTYHPWGADGSTVPSDVKYTRAQVVNFVRNHA